MKEKEEKKELIAGAITLVGLILYTLRPLWHVNVWGDIILWVSAILALGGILFIFVLSVRDFFSALNDEYKKAKGGE